MTRRMTPCPFCGLSASLEQSVGCTAVACGQCGACGPAFAGHDDAAANDAVADWNTRPFEGALLSRAEAAEQRAEAAEAALATMSLVCAHCGPESAGPAADNGRACATCYGTLILTDAAGAAELRRRYDDAVGGAEAAQARAEGEAAGAARERAAVVAYLRDHRDVAPRSYGGQHVGCGPNPAVGRFVLREAIPDIEAGAHVAPAAGGAR